MEATVEAEEYQQYGYRWVVLLVYGLVFTAGTYYILKLIGKGPDTTTEDTYGTHGVKEPPLVTDLAAETGGKDV